MSASGTGLVNLTPGPYGDDRKPDCKMSATMLEREIVFWSDRHHFRGEIYKLSTLDPTIQTRLTSDDVYDSDPRWCGADQIIFIKHDPDYPPGLECPLPPGQLPDQRRRHVSIMDKNGGNFRMLNCSDVENRTPSCSPDGTQVAWSATDWVDCFNPGAGVITRMPICPSGCCDASTHVKLTIHSYNVHPSWSPGASQIVFSSNRAANDGTTDFEIYKMDAILGELADLTPLTGGPGQQADDVSPDWREALRP